MHSSKDAELHEGKRGNVVLGVGHGRGQDPGMETDWWGRPDATLRSLQVCQWMMDAPGATCLLDTYPYKLTSLSSESGGLCSPTSSSKHQRLSAVSVDAVEPPSNLRGVHIHPLCEEVESIYQRPAPEERILHKENVHTLGGKSGSREQASPLAGPLQSRAPRRAPSRAESRAQSSAPSPSDDPLLSDSSYAQRLSHYSPVSLLSRNDFLVAQEVARSSQLQYSLEHSASARRLVTRARYVLLDASLCSASSGSFEAVLDMCEGCTARHQVVALNLCGWGWWTETDEVKTGTSGEEQKKERQQEYCGQTDTGTPHTTIYAANPTLPTKFPEFAHSALFRAGTSTPTTAHWPETSYPVPPQAAFLQRTKTVLHALLPYVDVLFCTDRACGPLWMALTDEDEGMGEAEGTEGSGETDGEAGVGERVRDRLRGGGPSVWRMDGSEVDGCAPGAESTGGACKGGSHAARLSALVSTWRKASGRRARACVVIPTAAANPTHDATDEDKGDAAAAANASTSSGPAATRAGASHSHVMAASRTLRSQVPEVRRAAAGLVNDISISISGLVIDTSPQPVGTAVAGATSTAKQQKESRQAAALDGGSVGSVGSAKSGVSAKSNASRNTYSTHGTHATAVSSSSSHDSIGRAGSIAMVREKARLRLDQAPVRAFDPAASAGLTPGMGSSTWGSAPFHSSTSTAVTGREEAQVLVGLLGQVFAVPHWPAFITPTHPITASPERPPEPRGRGKRVRLRMGHLRLCDDDGLPPSASPGSVFPGRSLSPPSSPLAAFLPSRPESPSPQETLAGLDAFVGGYIAALSRIEAQLDAQHVALTGTAQAAAASYIVDTRALATAGERAAYRSRFGCELDGSPAVRVNRRDMLDTYSKLGRDLVSGRRKPPAGPALPLGLGLGGTLPPEAYHAEVPLRPPEVCSVAGGRRAIVECVRAGCFARTASWDEGGECDYFGCQKPNT